MPSSVPLLALPLRQLLFIIRCVTARKMTNLVPRRRHVNPVSDEHRRRGTTGTVLLFSGAHLPGMIFHPLLAAHASARMLFTSTTISIWLPGVVALANGPRASQGGRMSRHDRRIREVAVLVLTAGSILWHAGASAAEGHEETIVLIRHGEKPAGGLGQLNCQGLNRSLALPRVLIAKFGKPAFIFAPNPQQETSENGQRYDYIRPLATIEPTAIQLGLPVNAHFGFLDIRGIQNELTQTKYHDALVFVAWEHELLAEMVKGLVAQGGGDPTVVPAWGHDDYDSIYIVKLARINGGLVASFTRDREGLNNQSLVCPKAP